MRTLTSNDIFFMKDLHDFIDEAIEKYNQKIYGGDMPVHNKGVLRSVLLEEERYARREELPNSNTSRDDF